MAGKYSKHIRPNRIDWMEYRMDGMAERERIKGTDKWWLKRRTRRREQREVRREILRELVE